MSHDVSQMCLGRAPLSRLMTTSAELSRNSFKPEAKARKFSSFLSQFEVEVGNRVARKPRFLDDQPRPTEPTNKHHIWGPATSNTRSVAN